MADEYPQKTTTTTSRSPTTTGTAAEMTDFTIADEMYKDTPNFFKAKLYPLPADDKRQATGLPNSERAQAADSAELGWCDR